MQKYIAGRYAQSLYDICAASLEKEALNFLNVLRENNFLSSLRIPTKVKVYVLDELNLPDKLRNLCKVLLLNHRGALCTEVLLKYTEIVKISRKEADVLIESCVPLSAKAKKETTGALLTKFSTVKKINIIQKVNPSLLGGMTIKMNFIMIDLSIIGRLVKYESVSRSAISEMFQ